MLHASTADLEPGVVSRYLCDVRSPELSSPCHTALVCLELTLNTSLSTLQLPTHRVVVVVVAVEGLLSPDPELRRDIAPGETADINIFHSYFLVYPHAYPTL